MALSTLETVRATTATGSPQSAPNTTVVASHMTSTLEVPSTNAARALPARTPPGGAAVASSRRMVPCWRSARTLRARKDTVKNRKKMAMEGPK